MILRKRRARAVGVGGWGGGGRVGPCSPSPTFWAKIEKKEDYHFTVENTEITTQRNSPFDFTKYVFSANL